MTGSTPVRVTIQAPQVPADRLSGRRLPRRGARTYDRPVPRPAGGAIGARRATGGEIKGAGLAVRRVEVDPDAELDPLDWPLTVPAVTRLARLGLDLGPATVLVGENGSGKSTLVEAIATAFGLNPEGGSTHARHSTRASESPLHRGIRLVRGAAGPRWGYFLRAETMHGLYTYLEVVARDDLSGRPQAALHEMSHGESFLEVLSHRFTSRGFYVLDEPESALSFSGCLALVGVLRDLVAHGSQVFVATHSPVVASLPGATILQLDGDGWTATDWDDLDLVNHHRRFLAAPTRYLRHVVDDGL